MYFRHLTITNQNSFLLSATFVEGVISLYLEAQEEKAMVYLISAHLRY